jgi:hypothetical protein
MKLLFLDFDGVLNEREPLHPEVLCSTFHPDKVKRLNRVLRETGAMIVVSSAWRYLIHRGEMNLAGFDWLLRCHGVIAGRLHGITRKDTTRANEHFDGKAWPFCNERGQQINDYLCEHPEVTRYAVVDDLDLGISEAGHPFVQTDGGMGMLEDDADQLIKILNASAGEP